MRYVLPDGLFGPGAPVAIRGQHGWHLLSAVPGEPWHETLVISDRAGLERATVARVRLPAGIVHHITRAGQTLVLITREAGLLHSRIVLRFTDEGEARVSGDPAGGEYRIARGGTTLAEISRRGLGCADRLAVDVAANQNEALLVAACIAVEDIARDAARSGLRGWLGRAA
jgi:uncharacterized protein YxjI